MNRNIVLITGILAAIMVFGAAVALARNTSENKNDTEDLECTPVKPFYSLQMEPINKQISFQ